MLVRVRTCWFAPGGKRPKLLTGRPKKQVDPPKKANFSGKSGFSFIAHGTDEAAPDVLFNGHYEESRGAAKSYWLSRLI